VVADTTPSIAGSFGTSKKKRESTTYEQFLAAFQRRGTLFALASIEFNSESSPVWRPSAAKGVMRGWCVNAGLKPCSTHFMNNLD